MIFVTGNADLKEDRCRKMFSQNTDIASTCFKCLSNSHWLQKTINRLNPLAILF